MPREPETRFPGFTVTHISQRFALATFQPEDALTAYEMAVRPPGVRVIGLTNDRTGIWMTDEFRSETGERDMRLPGGKVADSLAPFLDDLSRQRGVDSDAVLEAARREFREEVGLELSDLEIVSRSPCGASVLWDLYYVVGLAADGSPRQSLDAGEDIRPVRVGLDDAYRLALEDMSEERSAIQLVRVLRNSGLLEV